MNASNATIIIPTPKATVGRWTLLPATAPVIIFSDPANNKPNEIKMINGKPPIIGCKSINIEKKNIAKPRVI
jgi:hypothetical protein